MSEINIDDNCNDYQRILDHFLKQKNKFDFITQCKMGISNFFNAEIEGKKIKDFGKIVTIDKFKGQKIAIDAMNTIYRNMYAMKLSTSKEKRTSHILITLNMVIKFKKSGINQIWLFDSGSAHKLKAECIKKRKESTSQRITGDDIREVQKLLRLLGIPYMTAPNGVEAEILGSEMTKTGFCEGVITSDADVIATGGIMLKPAKGGKYLMIDAKDIGVSVDDLLRMAIHIGTDFAPGTYRIGPKTVYKKRCNEFTERQQLAYNYMKSKIVMSEVKFEFPKPDLPKLYEWLEELEFNVEKRKKKIDELF